MLSNQPLDSQYGTSIDVYSFGIVMWELLFEDNPYLYRNKEKLFIETPFEQTIYSTLTSYNILNEVVKGLRPVIPFSSLESCRSWCDKYVHDKMTTTLKSDTVIELTDLMKRCWNATYQDRPQFDEIVKNLVEINKHL